jgi:4-amino-4-deoxy-L-arabinose transferase-like glycosyltransferase
MQTKTSQSIPAWQTIAVAALVFLIVLLPRIIGLDQFVTADEPFWLSKSANFYYALGQRDFANTLQREYPAVTTMWAGTAGFLWRFPEYRGSGVGQIIAEKHEKVFRDLGQEPLQLLAADRVFVVLGVTLTITISVLYLWRLWSLPVALLSAALIAFDPFFTGMSRILHMDAFLAAFMLLSLVAFFSYLYRGGRTIDLLVSGAAAGLSWLSKSPGLFLVPFLGLLTLVQFWRFHRISAQRITLKQLIRMLVLPLTLWFSIGAIVFVVLWPVMWVQPIETIKRMLSLAEVYASEGHGSANFFMGIIYYWNQRPAITYLFYPITYLWRTTPVVLLGLPLCAAGYITHRAPLQAKPERSATAGIALYSLLFLLFITIGNKLADRYVLSIYPALDILGALGWVAAARWLRQRFHTPRMGQLASYGLLFAVGLFQVLGTLPTYPYYLDYYNPLVGGSRTAPQVLGIGWGEGLDQAARYLAEMPDADQLTVASWYGYGSFSYLFPGKTIVIPALPKISSDAAERMLSSDYMVIYISQWQRRIPEVLLAQLDGKTPVYTVQLNGLDYVQIYQLGHQQ